MMPHGSPHKGPWPAQPSGGFRNQSSPGAALDDLTSLCGAWEGSSADPPSASASDPVGQALLLLLLSKSGASEKSPTLNYRFKTGPFWINLLSCLTD